MHFTDGTMRLILSRLDEAGYAGCSACRDASVRLSARPAILIYSGPPFTVDDVSLLTGSSAVGLAVVTCPTCGHVDHFDLRTLAAGTEEYEATSGHDRSRLVGGRLSDRLLPTNIDAALGREVG
jgi:hypothetical protein